MRDGLSRIEMDRALLGEQDPGRLCALAVERVLGAIRARAVTIFLYSKRGRLVPAASAGSLPANAEKEEYAADEDIVGRCVSRKPAQVIITERPFEETSTQFMELFTHVIAQNTQIAYLPLNGPNRAYGVLRIIGGRDANGRERRLSFRERNELNVFSHQVAMSLSTLRRQLELGVLAHVNKLVSDQPGDVGRVYDEVTKALVEPATEFAACVIRIRDRSGRLELLGLEAASGMKMVKKDDPPLRPDSGFLREAFDRKAPVIVQDVQKRLASFHDPDWIRENDFATAAYFPILDEDERLGVLSLYCWYPYDFYESKISFLKTLCQQVATAARVVHLLNSRQKLIDTMSAVVSHSGDNDELLRTVLYGACTLTDANQGYVSMIDRRTVRLQPRVMTPNLAEQSIPRIELGGRGLTALAVRTRASVRRGDVSEDDAYVDFAGDAAEKTRSEIVVPLMYGQHVLGVIALESDQTHYFSEGDEAPLEALARNATLMFQRDRLHQATASLANADFSRASSDLPNVIARSAVEIVDADAAILRKYDASTNELVYAAHYPASMDIKHVAPTMARSVGVCWDALATGKVVRFERLPWNPRFHNQELATTNGYTEMVSVPLLLPRVEPEPGTPVGVINLFFHTSNPFYDVELPFLQVLGVAASYAIHDRAVIEESNRTQAMAAVTARATTAVELMSQLARRTVEPLSEARLALESIERALRGGNLVGIPKPLVALQKQLTRIETIVAPLAWSDRGSARSVKPTDAAEVLADAFRFIHTNLFAGTGKPNLQIGEPELWEQVSGALHHVLELVRLPVAAAYLSTHRDYSEMQRVAMTPREQEASVIQHIALSSFEEFVWLTERPQLVLPKDSGRFAWLDPQLITRTPRAIVYGHEVTGGRLLIAVVGLPSERVLTFEDLAALYEMIAVQIFSYIDNAMFGIELDFLTSETGHLMGRAIGKVESGARELLRDTLYNDDAARTLARSAIEDGLNRLKLIHNNFYWFSVQRKMLDEGVSRPENTVVGGRFIDVQRMLEEMMPLFRREALERGMKPTRFYGSTRRKLCVLGPVDPLRLTLLNLYDNALKFAYSDTHIDIRLWIDGRYCCVSFENLGTGVAPDEFETVFERMRRSRYQDRSKRVEGLGLGLSYCRRVVREIFHGEISLTSRAVSTRVRPYEGYNYLTTVTMKLPLVLDGQDGEMAPI